jgi:hypothetical protein
MAVIINCSNLSSVFISIVFPSGFVLPNKFSAAASVNTRLCRSSKAVTGDPCTTLKEKTEKNEGSAKATFSRTIFLSTFIKLSIVASRKRT